ncbi:MAG: DUF5752 family protein [Pseudomonadota bacterium]
MKIAKTAFRFFFRLNLLELTGINARTIPELLEHIKTIDDACIFQHTHHFIQRHQYLSPEPPNDFSYWVSEAIGARMLGEELASIDIMGYSNLKAIRKAIIKTLEKAIKKSARLRESTAPEGEEFNFLRSISFVFPTEYEAKNLQEFSDSLSKVSISSIYYHLFEARLRLKKQTNDFSNWFVNALQENEIAAKVAQLDPYTQTGEGIRKHILKLVDAKIARDNG